MYYTFKEENAWGMINEKGEIIIEPVYEKLSNFAEGYALGRLNEKWHYIDKKGRRVKRFNIDEMNLFREGMARMNICGCVGYVDNKFQVAIEPQYGIYSSSFSEGFAAVCSPDKFKEQLYGFINKKGQQIVDFKYESARNFCDGLAVVTIDDKMGAVNKDDNLVISAKYDWINDFNEGRAFFRVDDLWGIVDNLGNEIVEAKFKQTEEIEEHYEMQFFSDGFAVIYENNSFCYIDINGNIAANVIYDEANPFSEGLASVRFGDKWIIIDRDFKSLAELNYDTVGQFKEGLASISKNGKRGFANKKGDIVINPQYDYVSDFCSGAAAVIRDKRYGYIDKAGNEFFRAKKSCKEPYYSFIH